MHNVHIGKSPRYLADLVQPTSSRVTSSGLCSLSETDSYTTPRLLTKFGERAFSFSGPASWNSLPAELRTISDTNVFKNKFFKNLSFWVGVQHSVDYRFVFYASQTFLCRFLLTFIVLHLCSYVSL